MKLHELNITKFSLKISCLEIYQEHVYDLFAEERERVSLPVREHMAEGAVIIIIIIILYLL